MYVTGARENYELEPGAFNQTKTNLMVFILLTKPKKRESLKPTVQSFEEARMWLKVKCQAKSSILIFTHLVQKSYSATALGVSSPIKAILFKKSSKYGFSSILQMT